NIVDRNKKEVISYLHGTSEPSPEFLKSWNNTIYPGYKNKLDNYPKISELYILIDDIIKDKGEIGRASCRERLKMWVRNGSSRRRHTRSKRDWSSDVCSSDL